MTASKSPAALALGAIRLLALASTGDVPKTVSTMLHDLDTIRTIADGALQPPAPNTYTTGTGQRLTVHAERTTCAALGCVIHSPTDPHSDWPTNFRESGLMERICPHGVGHPDLDSLRFFERNGVTHLGVHGCDGCCGAAQSAP